MSRYYHHKRCFSSLLYAFLGLILFSLCLHLAGTVNWQKLVEINISWLVLGTGLVVALEVLFALRWHLFVSSLRRDIPLALLVRIVAFTSFLGFLIPKDLADIGGRAILLSKDSPLSLADAGNTVLCDRLMDVYLLVLTLPSCLLYILGRISLLWTFIISISSVCAGLLLLLCIGDHLFSIFAYCLSLLKKLSERIPLLRGRIRADIASIHFRTFDLVLIYLITLLRYSLLCLVYWACGQALSLPISLLSFFVAVSIIQLAFIFSFTAGGLGVLELGWLTVFSIMGIEADASATYILAQRVFFMLSVAVAFMILWLFTRRAGLTT